MEKRPASIVVKDAAVAILGPQIEGLEHTRTKEPGTIAAGQASFH